jgi:phosphate transport system substrate-binding protein
MTSSSTTRRCGGTVALLAGLAWSAAHAELPAYQPAQGLAGSLVSVGSDTLENVVEGWGQAFTALHPEVTFAIDALGSGTAPPALIQGISNLAPMSRQMTDAEAAAYEEAFGYEPVFLRVALDALAVYVHKDNPIRGLTFEQLDGMFSAGQACGGGAIASWGHLVFGPLAGQPIEAFGRDARSGTHDEFARQALCGGTFGDQVHEEPDSATVVDAVAGAVNAIGYAGIGYRTEGVRAIAISRGPDDEDDPYYPYFVAEWRDDPDLAKRYAYVIDGRYPLARFLYLYVSKAPGEPLDPAVEAFVRFALSRQGQAIVHEVGYIPLPESMVEDELPKLQPDHALSWWSFD